MLKIKWTDRVTNDEDFQKAKKERIVLRILKNRRHTWIVHTVGHNGLVVNILEGAIFGEKKFRGKTWTAILKQVARNTAADSCTAVKWMSSNKSRWKAANQSKDRGIRRSNSN